MTDHTQRGTGSTYQTATPLKWYFEQYGPALKVYTQTYGTKILIISS